MTDRNVQYPYRFHVRPVPGTDDICEIIPAPGTVYEEGTFWNKQNVLQDVVAALYDKDGTATPNDIFAAIRPMIQAAYEKNKIVEGSYTGAGASQTITFDFQPIFFCVTGLCLVGNIYKGALAVGTGDLVVGSYSSGSASYGTAQLGTIEGNVVTITGRLLTAGQVYHYIAIG